MHRRHAELHLARKFLGNRFGPLESAHVRTECHLDSRVQRLAERHSMQRHTLAIALSLLGVRGIPIGVVHLQGRHVPRTLLEHLRDLRVRYLQPVLDRITTAVECALQTRPVVGVAGHSPSPAMGLIHDGLQFFDGERRLRHQGALCVEPGAMGHIHLDPIRALVQLLARRLACFDGSVDQL